MAGFGGRLAGSDFVISPNTTNEVGVALTDLGKQVVPGQRVFRAEVMVDLLDYGMVLYAGSATGNTVLTLTSTDPPTYPAGATASCGATLFAGRDTSCPFAQNVEQAYSSGLGTVVNGVTAVTAVSPATGQTYQMQCTQGSPDICRGGTNALVEFYK
jgi:hypothetical protein